MPTLVWAGKENATKEANSVPYRLLERDESLCYGDATAGNVIVQGDNLAALKALMPYYRGRVRCIYIVISSIISSGIRNKQGKPFFSSQLYLAKAA